ncbi:MAG: carboxyl transferase [Lachnospiraceae bacterium]|nr:carboxyl transferase [Lachnospiraceae bacterium]
MSTNSKASERIQSLLDENSFVEIGGKVTARATDFNLEPKDTPADGVVTGYGLINDRLVYVYSQDAAVLGGSVGEMHAKKICGLYDLALKVGAPVIGLIDCAGLRLQEGTDALYAFGEIYRKQSLASGVIPQISALFGNCGGGLALIPTLTDFTFMEEDAKLFVNAPNALDENYEAKNDTASATFQSGECGTVDFVGKGTELFDRIRELVSMLPDNNEANDTFTECTDDLNRGIAQNDSAVEVLKQIADDNAYVEVQSAYAKDITCGLMKLNGVTVGAVANCEEKLSPYGCVKAADFVNFCDAFEIPVLTLTNVTGFEATVEAEKKMAKAAAKLAFAFANATVPKVNVVTGKAFGNAVNVMNSKSLGCDMTFAWEDASIGMMDGKLAAKVMYAGSGTDVLNEKAGEYDELQNSVLSAARRGYVDTIIAPVDTRKYVIGAFEMLFTKREEIPAKKHGTV